MRVRACECGEGGVDDCQKKEAYLKAGVEKELSTKLVILQIRPITSSLCPVPSGYVRTWPQPAGHTHRGEKRIDTNANHKGLGEYI